MGDRGLGYFGERYGSEGPAPRFAQWNEVIEALLGHRSVRRYAPKPLPEGTLELLVAAAQSAPSSSNLQLWSVLSVEDAERRRRLSELAGGQAHIRACRVGPGAARARPAARGAPGDGFPAAVVAAQGSRRARGAAEVRPEQHRGSSPWCLSSNEGGARRIDAGKGAMACRLQSQ
ncbi:nitroreductase family protein [Sorangium sp. So ce367]